MRGGWWTLLAAVAAAGLLGGCATLGTVGKAREALARAEASGAEARAPYDYHAARAYLEMAEHEKDELDWKAAREWAQKALDHASRALAAAGGGDR